MKVAVIPARGGSKRVPRKNIRPFAGKPMIAHSIAAAQASGAFDEILVSTDDAEIVDVARACGANIPFMRPAELADDLTGTTAVVSHAASWMLDQHWAPDSICCIYATAPFVRGSDIRHGLDVLVSGDWAYVFSATPFAAPIQRAFRRHADGGVEMFFPEQFFTRSQDLPEALHDAAQFYWGTAAAWLEQKLIFEVHSCPIVLPRWRVQDIDTEVDWHYAELLWEVLSKEP